HMLSILIPYAESRGYTNGVSVKGKDYNHTISSGGWGISEDKRGLWNRGFYVADLVDGVWSEIIKTEQKQPEWVAYARKVTNRCFFPEDIELMACDELFAIAISIMDDLNKNKTGNKCYSPYVTYSGSWNWDSQKAHYG